MINVTGGEPLVREDLFDVMAYALSLGFHWGLVTNGVRLTPPAVRALKESGCQTASISIDGCAETHDRLRGVPGGLERVLEGIRLLKQENFLETLMISTTVSRQNLRELPQIKTLLAALPIDVWRISAVDSIGRADDNVSLLLSKDQMDELFRFIAACRNELLPYAVMTSCSHYLGRYEFRVRDVPFQCMTGKTVGSILANGDIYVCPDVPRVPEHIQGNVRQDDFMDVWNSGFKFFRERENRRAGICARCRIFSKCAGDCTHTWDFEKNEPKFCPLTYGLVDPKAPPDVDTAIFAELIARVKKGNSPLSGAVVRSQSLAKDRVILSPGASRDIFSIFRKDTDYEQLGVLCGQIYWTGNKMRRHFWFL